MEWCGEHENLLKEWAEKARFYSWMHHTTSSDYGKLNNMLTIPMIIISIVDGSANFTMVGNSKTTFVYTTLFPIMLGTLSIITGILSALTKYLKTAELTEKHELFYRQFNVLVRNISQELSLPPNQRKIPSEALNMSRYEFDRLVNEAPLIPEHVIAEFNKRFPYKKNKPEIANTFSKIVIHGRELNYKKRLDEFQRIRLFYKWKAAKYIKNLEANHKKSNNRQSITIGDLQFFDSSMNYNNLFRTDSTVQDQQRIVTIDVNDTATPSVQSEENYEYVNPDNI